MRSARDRDGARPQLGRSGFTMVEALLCLALLGILATVVAAFVPVTRGAGLVRSDAIQLDLVRAKIEELQAGPVAAVSGSDTLDVGGEAVVRTWSMSARDLDRDGSIDADAFLLRVQMGPVNLETVRVEPRGLRAIKR